MTSSHSWRYDGYGKYGVKAIWMDESEPDHAAYISGGQWDLHAGTDTEIMPAWVKYWSKGYVLYTVYTVYLRRPKNNYSDYR